MEEPIAIVGLDARMPGGETPEAFFDFLCSGRSARSAVPASRFNVDAYGPTASPSGSESAHIVSKYGHFLAGSVHAFDAPFFSITPAEAAGIDPQQRNMLETVYKALENAGIALHHAAGTRTGVYIGCSSADFRDIVLKDLDGSMRYAGTGTINSMLSNRVSWFYDFKGPSMTIDTACSSSLVALHQAVVALRAGEVSMAVVGGTNLILSPEMTMTFSAMGTLSPDGISYSFDHRVNGFSRGEGFAAVVLKRLPEALRDGNSEPKFPHVYFPHSRGDSELQHKPRRPFASAYPLDPGLASGLDQHDIQGLGYVTYQTRRGTWNDPIEAGAIADAFAIHRTDEEPLYVGAMKSNCGHLEGAAGLAAIVKTVLSMERGIIPGNAWFERPNPSISDSWHLAFPTESIPWPRTATGLRRASVNCFGLGGANAHVVLDDALHFLLDHGLVGKHCTVDTCEKRLYEPASPSYPTAPPRCPKLFVFTAHDQDGVSRMRQAYRRFLSTSDAHPSDASEQEFLRDLGFTLAERRTQFPWRTAVVANSISSLQESLDTQDPAGPVRADGSRRLALVFTGQGTQWPTMGLGLMAYPVFRQSLEKADAYLRSLGCRWSLICRPHQQCADSGKTPDELSKKRAMSRVDEAEFSQPLCTALQVALVDLVVSWNVRAEAVVGHSSGEIAAAYAAKAITAEDAWRVAYYRGKLVTKLVKAELQPRTGMAAVGLELGEALAAVRGLERDHFQHPGRLEVACFNSRTNHTMSGETDRINALVASLSDKQVFARKLQVDIGYHSQYLQPMADEYANWIGGLGTKSVTRDSSAPCFYSSTVGAAVDASPLRSAAYWVENLVSPVRFQQSVTALMTENRGMAECGQDPYPFTDILEIGPHSGLKGPIKQIAQDLGLCQALRYHSLMESGSNEVVSILGAAGSLFGRGLTIDIPLVHSAQGETGDPKMLIGLPSYPFNHAKEHWSESRLSKAFAHRKHGRHEVLGTPVAHSSPNRRMWHHWLRLADIAWLQDHRVGDAILFPAAGMLAMAVEAARQATGDDRAIKGFRLRHVSFHSALHIPTDGGAGVETYFYLHCPRQAALGGSKASSRGSKEFELWSVQPDDAWVEHCRGTILVEHRENATPVDGGLEEKKLADQCRSQIRHAIACCRTRIPSAMLYTAFAEGHLHFGDTFQTLSDVHMDDPLTPRTTMASLRPNLPPPSGGSGTRQGLVLHPTMIDGVLQAGLAPLLINKDARCLGKPCLPVCMEEIWISAVHTHQDTLMMPVRSDAAFHGRNEVRCTCVAVDKQTMEPQVLVNGLIMKSAAQLSSTVVPIENTLRHVAWNTDWKPDVTFLNRAELESAFRLGEGPSLETYTELDDCNSLSCLYVEGALLRISRNRSPPTTHVRTDSGVDLPLEMTPLGMTASPGAEAPCVPDHLDRYIQLMRQMVANRKQQNPCEVLESMETLEARLKERGTATGSLVMAVGKELAKVLNGTADPLEILFSNGLAEEFYQTGYGMERTSAQLVGYLDALAHKNPLMKILEVGAGTGGTAKPVLDRLGSRYGRYDFTDVSPWFLDRAKDRFAAMEQVEYRILDIEGDPSTQGFQVGTYDVLLASNVLHATRDIVATLRNCLALLKPGGKLLLTEGVRPSSMMTNFVFGLLPGWWKSEEGDRQAGPLLSAGAWERYIVQSGFAGLDAVFPDYADDAYHVSSVLVCSAPKSSQDVTPERDPIIVGDRPRENLIIVADPLSDFQDGLVSGLKAGLEATASGIISFTRVMSRTLEEFAREDLESIRDSTCLFLTELEAPILSDLSEGALLAFKHMARCKTWLWLTKAHEAESELVRGFATCVRLENPELNFTTVAFDEPSRCVPATLVDTCLRVLQGSRSEPTADSQDDTFCFTNGFLHIPRLVEASYLTEHIRDTSEPPEGTEKEFGIKTDDAIRLRIRDLGLLDTLQFEEDRCSSGPLHEYDVEVQTMASGVNFYDLSVMLGRIEEAPLGVEGAGFVTRTGPRVTRFRAGDRVFGFALDGAFQTRFRTQEGLLAQIPDPHSYAEAAAMPVVYSMAYACLFDIGGLGEYQRAGGLESRSSSQPSVLIHAAAGGVGQAAIQFAQREGAEIYATVGSVEKRDFLETTYGIPRDHILSSRDLTFRDGLLRMTNGRGVDVILNSLSGDALRATWDCIAPFGRFAEMGLVDIKAQASLPMGSFVRNVRFEAVELHYMAQHAPRRLEDVFQRAVRAVLEQDGGLVRSTPIVPYPFSDVQTAMRRMQSGKHIGKLVLEPRKDHMVPFLCNSPSGIRRRFDGNVTYVVAGGLGGLGRAVVRWMVERGARFLLLLSRRGLPETDVHSMFGGLEGRYERIVAPACDLTNLDMVRRVVRDAAVSMPPIKGCFHGAMVLKDNVFGDMTVDEWQASVRVKVQRTKALWKVLLENGATPGTPPLAFFIILSSTVSVLGNANQSNYAAGNAFQDAFARQLASQGHPAVSVNVPVLSDVGFVAERPELMHHLRSAGWPCMSSRDLLAALEYYCFHQNHSPGGPGLTRQDRVRRAQVAPRLWLPRPSQASGQTASSWDKNPLLQPLKLWQHAEGGASRPGDDALENSAARTGSAKDRLASANTLKEAQEVVLEAFLSKLSRILSVGEAELSPARPLHAYGVDSLVAVELRSWFAKEVAADLTVSDMTSQSCIRQVAELAAARSASFSVSGRGS
ncbi:hypothetical protein PG991_001193 [Apiospora marii]|uniref:Carrier domain-containing protein n=1 Tax=Apiospora marii TaxID=335849 RepID=A0ABR1SU35_9PEZI